VLTLLLATSAEDDWSSYTEMVQELVRLKSETGLKLSDVPACGKALRRACKYAHMDEEKIVVQLCWYEKGPKEKPFTIDFGDFKSRPSRSLNCAVSLSFGDAMELAFIRSGSEETVFLDRPNGSLSLVGRDAWKRWKAGPRLSSKERSTRGHLSITVLGFTEKVVEEKELAPAPTDEKIGDKAWDGCLDEPCHDVVRPSMRVIAVPTSRKYERPVKHDDVIIVPEFFCKEDDWDIYYQLLKEMRESQAQGTRKAEWLSWHEGAHLLSQNPTGSASYQKVLDRMCEYFHIALGNRGTRFNWYRDGSDWKPFHHDSAAFNPMRAKDQNCTVGISFGASRELAFRHAKTGELVYFPQRNGMLFYFGQDANIIWQHGINALPKEEQDGKGRISIILWGLCTTTVDEPGSPPMLTDESRGKGKGKGKDKGKGKGKGKDKSWGFSMHQRR
jgi:hypothetical protein